MNQTPLFRVLVCPSDSLARDGQVSAEWQERALHHLATRDEGSAEALAPFIEEADELLLWLWLLDLPGRNALSREKAELVWERLERDARAEGVVWTPTMDVADTRGVLAEYPGLDQITKFIEPLARWMETSTAGELHALTQFRSSRLPFEAARRVRDWDEKLVEWVCGVDLAMPRLARNEHLTGATLAHLARTTWQSYRKERGDARNSYRSRRITLRKSTLTQLAERSAIPADVQDAMMEDRRVTASILLSDPALGEERLAEVVSGSLERQQWEQVATHPDRSRALTSQIVGQSKEACRALLAAGESDPEVLAHMYASHPALAPVLAAHGPAPISFVRHLLGQDQTAAVTVPLSARADVAMHPEIRPFLLASRAHETQRNLLEQRVPGDFMELFAQVARHDPRAALAELEKGLPHGVRMDAAALAPLLRSPVRAYRLAALTALGQREDEQDTSEPSEDAAQVSRGRTR